jgi:hypothetical protein
MLFRSGLNASQVQLWLGHHSPAFTLATYVHLLPDDLPDADNLARGGNTGATRPHQTERDAAPVNEPQTRMVPNVTSLAEVAVGCF